MKIAINQLLSCDGRTAPRNVQKRQLGAAPAAQPSPPLPSPTPSTSTCSRRAAKAKARGKSPRPMAKFCQVDGSRTRLVWLVGGRVWRAWDAPLQAQHSSGSATHRRPHPGLYIPAQQYAECSEEHTVKASASTPYSLPNARAGSLL